MRTVCLVLGVFLGLLPEIALAGWKTLAPIEDARADLSATAAAGAVYVGGGRVLQGPSATFESLDPKSSTWQPLPSMPQAVSEFGMAAIGSTIYVAGGFTDAAREKATANVWVFDTAAGNWSPGPAMPAPRGGHALVAAGGKLYVVGGEGSDAAHAFVLDPASGHWSVAGGALAHPRAGLGAAVMGNQIYVVGGRNSAEVDVYDIGKGAWHAGPALPGPRAGAAAGVIGGRLHVAGGQRVDPFKTYAEHLVLDPKSGSWSHAAEMPTPRHGVGSAVLDGSWYVIGGGKGAGVFTTFTASDNVEVYRE